MFDVIIWQKLLVHIFVFKTLKNRNWSRLIRPGSRFESLYSLRPLGLSGEGKGEIGDEKGVKGREE